jgi:N-methylhydantoinase B
MGVVLQRTSFSPNIKERKDFSCAIFDEDGKMVAQAAHIPVHLGSMPLPVKSVIESLELKEELIIPPFTKAFVNEYKNLIIEV